MSLFLIVSVRDAKDKLGGNRNACQLMIKLKRVNFKEE